MTSELEPRRMPDGEVAARVAAVEARLDLLSHGIYSPPLGGGQSALVAHVLWLQDELERVMEDRDTVRDRRRADLDTGLKILHNLQAARRDLDEAQEEGNVYLKMLDQIRTTLGLDPATDLVEAVKRVAHLARSVP